MSWLQATRLLDFQTTTRTLLKKTYFLIELLQFFCPNIKNYKLPKYWQTNPRQIKVSLVWNQTISLICFEFWLSPCQRCFKLWPTHATNKQTNAKGSKISHSFGWANIWTFKKFHYPFCYYSTAQLLSLLHYPTQNWKTTSPQCLGASQWNMILCITERFDAVLYGVDMSW